MCRLLLSLISLLGRSSACVDPLLLSYLSRSHILQNKQQQNGNKAGNTNTNNKGGATAAAATAAAANTASAATAVAANSNTDAQNSLSACFIGTCRFFVDLDYLSALDPRVIATGFEQDGQANATAGQVPSATSSNNFINFCLLFADKPITNGQQIKTGSCNPNPMGIIAATTNMPSSKFVNPPNGGTIQANTAFTIQMALNHLEAGNFVNAQTNYYAAPQT